MKKHHDKLFNEDYYIETLDNGLTIIIFYKPQFFSTTCAFGVPYGSLNIHQKIGNKKYDFNPGIAHFLEHKLFETDDKDITNDFSKIGANVNAYTSYKETIYYFSTCEKDIKTPLNMLLDFVQNFSITKQSVEKEKPIIIEEVSMYKQDPITRLFNEAYGCLYKEYPLKYDIGGDVKTINKITKDELETCYRINYHPNNMVLIVSSYEEPKKIVEMVKENQSKKKFKKIGKVKNNDPKEPEDVVKKSYSFKMPINTNKQIIAYKINRKFKDLKEAFFYQTCLSFLLDACLSPINSEYQEWLDSGLINDFFGFDLEFSTDCSYVSFFIESDNKKTLEQVLKKALKPENIDEDILKQIKRRYIGTFFSNLNYLELFTLDFLKDYLEGMNLFEELKIINSIKLKDVKKSIEFVENTPKTIINMHK